MCCWAGRKNGDLDVVGLADLVVRGGGADAERVVVLGLLRHGGRRSLSKNTPGTKQETTRAEHGSGGLVEEEE